MTFADGTVTTTEQLQNTRLPIYIADVPLRQYLEATLLLATKLTRLDQPYSCSVDENCNECAGCVANHLENMGLNCLNALRGVPKDLTFGAAVATEDKETT